MMKPILLLWTLLTTVVLFGEGWSETEGCWEQERIALLQLKSFFNDPHSLSSWVDVKGSDCCQWERVECNITTGRVIGLHLNYTHQGRWKGYWECEVPYGYLNASLFLPFEELKTLHLFGNGIVDFIDNQVSLSSALGNLEIFGLGNNCFNGSIFSSSKLNSLTNLKILDLSWNRIKSLHHFQELNSLTNLKILDLGGNHIKSLRRFQELNSLTNLKILDLSGNHIKSLQRFQELNSLTNLKILDLSSNRIKSLQHFQELNSLTNLKILDLSWNRIKSLHHFQGKKAQLKINLEVLDLSHNLLKNNTLPYLIGLSSLKSLNIEENNLQGSIDIEALNNLTNLKKLDMSNNKIESLQSSHDGERQLKLINLEELDLSSNSFNNSILTQLSRLTNLRSLNLESNRLKGSINLKELDALTNLEELDISYNEVKEFLALKNKANKSLGKLKVAYLDGVFIRRTASLLQLLETFSSVKTLFLRGNYLNDTTSTQDWLHVSSKVEELLLDYSYLNKNILQSIGVLASLKTLFLRSCGLTGTLPTQGWCDLRKLEVLDLSENALEGTLPSCLGNLSSLHFLDISGNQFSGNGASTSLGNLTLLRFVFLSRNLFQVPSFFISFANHSHLKVLASNQNKLVKEPTFRNWVPKFQLKVFRLSNCTTKELHNELPKFLYYQYDLSIIDLSYNNLGGNIPFWLLENNTRLEVFLMKSNSFSGHLQCPSHPNPNMSLIDISDNKIQGQIPTSLCSTYPQLRMLNLSGNNFEGNIPPCLGSLNTTSLFLDLSHNQLSGQIPEKLAKSDSLWFLRLSNNHLSGKISPMIFSLDSLLMLYLDGNNFDGGIPGIDISRVRLSSLLDIDLSNNNLSGELPRWIWNLSNLNALALSNNQLEGPIPMELCYLDGLKLLDLSQNNFSGPIPSCFNAQSLIHLHLSRNRLTGTLTSAFFNSSSLVTLDLSENRLTGEIPYWVGTLSNLSVLLLKANNLTGDIPIELCKSYSLSIIDLSQNKLSGSIPSCLSNLTLGPNDKKSSTRIHFANAASMVQTADYFGLTIFERATLGGSDATYVDFSIENLMEEEVDFTTKRVSYRYRGNILEYMSGIDLSCNKLTGEIPLEIGNLSEIRSLNLSHNNFTGHVPSTFSKLKQIESLDLSYNSLVGRIPVQLTELNALAIFNVSYNKLSGSIPPQKAQFGTFDESSYLGNPSLCGPPLHKNCNEPNSPSTAPNASNGDEESGLVDKYVFCVTFFVSYAVVLLVIVAILYINPYWRRIWFYFIEQCIRTCHVLLVDNLLQLSIFRRRR